MKKVLIAVSLLIVGCQKEEVKTCDCLRITDIKHDSLVFYENTVYTAEITTISDCTFLQTKRMFNSDKVYNDKKIGDCL